MTGFTSGQSAVLRQLHTVWPEDRFVVVGAAAIGCHMDFHWRQTHDLDLTIAAGIEECRELLTQLGWVRHERIEHAWTAAGNVRVDVIPVTEGVLESGQIDWAGGTTMSVVGLRTAFADNVRVDLGQGLCVRVASAAAITILKMVASLDRPDRERDLADLAHMMDGVVDSDDPERWTDDVFALDLEYDSVGPFVLGRRVASLANDDEKAVVQRFLARLEDPSDRSASLGRMIREGPRAWRDEDVALARLQAFRQGFTS